MPQPPCEFAVVSKVSHVTLGTLLLGTISFDFRGQDMGMYIKNLTCGHVHGLKYMVSIAHQLAQKCNFVY